MRERYRASKTGLSTNRIGGFVTIRELIKAQVKDLAVARAKAQAKDSVVDSAVARDGSLTGGSSGHLMAIVETPEGGRETIADRKHRLRGMCGRLLLGAGNI